MMVLEIGGTSFRKSSGGSTAEKNGREAMTLTQIGMEYRASAEPLRRRLKDLNEE